MGTLAARSRSPPASSEILASHSASGTRERRKRFAWANGSEVINPSKCMKRTPSRNQEREFK